MQIKNEIQTGLAAEIRIVPTWAWALAGAIFIAMQILCNFFLAGLSGAPPEQWRALIGVVGGMFIGCFVLLIGYVNRDARRRGMNAILWTLLAILIPHGLGLILYFILRQPLQRICPQCGTAVQTGFNFCPRCSYKLSPSCPKCQRLVGANDVFCPYCGSSLRSPAAEGGISAHPAG